MTPMGAGLTVLMFVGAANADAAPEQRSQLKAAIEPLSDKSIPASEAYAQTIRRTASIMGPRWRPAGEWDEWITALLEEPEPQPICPECVHGKHQNCDQQAWDPKRDEPTSCGCSHNGGAQ